VDLDEYTKWLDQDPHTRAYAVLFEDRSRQIAERLGMNDHPSEAETCLVCHTNPLAAKIPATPDRELVLQERQFGVGCEACHGPAAKWLTAHTDRSWRDFTPQKKAMDFGMVPVSDIAARARNCAGCHVGSAPSKDIGARDVNHDLIAGGHPRLTFALTSYLANLPPHWKVRTPPVTGPVQVWAVGQITVAEAALDLLAHRATSLTAPWPEFAEHDCFACHHGLHGGDWRQRREHYGSRRPGSLPWNDWYTSMPRLLAAQHGDFGLWLDLGLLEHHLAKPAAPGPQIAAQARDAAKNLERLRQRLERAPFTPAALKQLLIVLTAGDAEAVQSWDTAEQLYQSAWVMNEVLQNEKLASALRGNLAAQRAFPTGRASPAITFRPPAFHKALAAALNDLR
jgi:hypothetical protein